MPVGVSGIELGPSRRVALDAGRKIPAPGVEVEK